MAHDFMTGDLPHEDYSVITDLSTAWLHKLAVYCNSDSIDVVRYVRKWYEVQTLPMGGLGWTRVGQTISYLLLSWTHMPEQSL
jgi:hypothetical protein